MISANLCFAYRRFLVSAITFLFVFDAATAAAAIISAVPATSTVTATSTCASASLVPSLRKSFRCVRALAIRSEQLRGSVFFDRVQRQAPKYDRHSPLLGSLVRWESVDAVFPADIHVPAEREDAVVRLRKVQTTGITAVAVTVVIVIAVAVVAASFASLRVILTGSKESQLSGGTKGHAHGDILVLCSVRIEGGRIMVERLPVVTIFVPVETSPHGGLSDIEVLAELVDDIVERLGAFRILHDEMRALVPCNPVASAHVLRLKFRHFLHELVVEGPIILVAEQFGNDDDIVMPERSRELFLRWQTNFNPNIRPHQRRLRVETLRISPRGPFGVDVLGWIVAPWILAEVGRTVFVRRLLTLRP
eukprot:CAMPEP_0119555682 /NCGR_PEP_ID=MMETSP1352-20130426/7814_1 /TAXON_ID=265584 /ORGANISM="Stauroneis constricta, Strain CCMP1120" /LENGTH=362 /DNA_ID=CAMNT_0007602487 /DNA_START=434 /DNA_END=1519 /DNA_ORIENTATION=+